MRTRILINPTQNREKRCHAPAAASACRLYREICAQSANRRVQMLLSNSNGPAGGRRRGSMGLHGGKHARGSHTYLEVCALSPAASRLPPPSKARQASRKSAAKDPALRLASK